MPAKSKWIGYDKALHLIVGVVLYVGLQDMLPVFLLAVLKECIDEIKYKGFDYKDLFVTVFGGVIGIVLVNYLGYFQ